MESEIDGLQSHGQGRATPFREENGEHWEWARVRASWGNKGKDRGGHELSAPGPPLHPTPTCV